VRIKKENSVAVIIDIQERLFPFIYDNQKLSANTVKLIQGLKTIGLEILVTEQYTKGLGPTIKDVRDALGTTESIEKISFSCCGDNKFLETIGSTGKKNVIIAGIESHVCVLQTVIDLIDAGYQPVVIEDCVSSRKLNDKLIAVERMRKAEAIISTYESILFEILEVSGTEAFKAISKIVK